MIERLVLFGATGDLAGRYVLPAVAALHAAGELPDRFEVTGAAIEPMDDESFRRHVAERLAEHADGVPAGSREAVVGSLAYRQVDFAGPEGVARAVHADGRALAAYLALPPAVFPGAIEALAAAGLPDGSRVVVEKPFGEDLRGAERLNALIARLFGVSAEQTVFRVDHFLGLASVQNLLGLRLGNRMIDPAWNGAHVEHVEIVWEETLGLEGRAGYYDSAGALKDVIQNHLIQVLCLLAMEPPGTLDERDLRDAKVELLRSVLPPDPSRSRRARYAGYADEEGVDPARCTETFAEVVLEIGNERWAGTRFVLRAAKAMARDRMEVVVRFRPPPNTLRLDLLPPQAIALELTGRVAGAAVPLSLGGRLPESDIPEYGRVLLDVLRGGCTLSVRGDEAEQAWRVVTPVLDAWQAGRVPLEEYPAGSEGPS
jgi:glucose-6-phosphate 1-dehydrogenase